MAIILNVGSRFRCPATAPVGQLRGGSSTVAGEGDLSATMAIILNVGSRFRCPATAPVGQLRGGSSTVAGEGDLTATMAIILNVGSRFRCPATAPARAASCNCARARRPRTVRTRGRDLTARMTIILNVGSRFRCPATAPARAASCNCARVRRPPTVRHSRTRSHREDDNHPQRWIAFSMSGDGSCASGMGQLREDSSTPTGEGDLTARMRSILNVGSRFRCPATAPAPAVWANCARARRPRRARALLPRG
jgi:hypothetical protein